MDMDIVMFIIKLRTCRELLFAVSIYLLLSNIYIMRCLKVNDRILDITPYRMVLDIRVCLMMFNATFNNISVISWRSVLLVDEIRGPRENHWPVASHWQLYQIMLHTSPWSRFELTRSVVIGTYCIGSCKSNYHTIMATTAP